MSSHENSAEPAIQSQPSYETIYQEVVDLQIVEGFFSAVERKFLQFSSSPFEVKRAKDALLTLQELHENGSPEDFSKALQLLVKLTLSWKKQLVQRDVRIETQQLRRFCDEFKKPFDAKVFTALARFYLSLPHSLSTQSKYDFAVTRLFLKPTVNNVREIKFERDTVIGQLSALGTGWNVHPSFSQTTDQRMIEIITKFDEFIFEAEFITNFEELVESRLFENLRDFKSEVGDLFYHPSVTASAIECNVFVGNIFAELLAQENEKLSRIISNEFDYAGVLHDTSPTAIVASNQILENIRTGSRAAIDSPDEDATHIWEWLQSVCAKKAEKIEVVEVRETETAKYPAKERISYLVKIIDDPASDKSPLSEYFQKSVMLKSLDFGIFLAPETAEDQKKVFRATLSAVIWAEELRMNELMKHDKLADETTTEISLLLAELQELSEQLKIKVDEMESAVTHNLLYVSNQLLESRLKLERAIVRYSKANMEAAPVVEQKPQTLPASEKRSFFAPTFEVNRWILACTVFVALLSFGAYFAADFMGSAGKILREIEIVETSQLPGRENFATAQRVRDSLHITANSTWKRLDEDKQREILKELLKYPSTVPIANVIIMDDAGNEISTASPELIETTSQIVNLAN